MRHNGKKAAINCWVDKRLMKLLTQEAKRQKRTKTALLEIALDSFLNGKELAA